MPPPVPERLARCGESFALSLSVRAAVRLPGTVGLKVTLIVHEAFTARVAGQLLVWAKSLGLVPVRSITMLFKGPCPVFVKVIFWAALVEPTFCVPKVRLAGLSETAPASVQETDPLRNLPLLEYQP